MHREQPESKSAALDRKEQRSNQRKRRAMEVLLEARERLVAQLYDSILASEDMILDSSSDGIFGFEFQELEDRYSARLHALNSILENLEFRRPKITHHIETFRTTPAQLEADLASLVERFDQWDLVDIDVTPLRDDEYLVVVAFTTDEYSD